VLYIWCAKGAREPGKWCISRETMDKIAAHVLLAKQDPHAVRECRVIRCTGEEAP
jgi:hypothetical protein